LIWHHTWKRLYSIKRASLPCFFGFCRLTWNRIKVCWLDASLSHGFLVVEYSSISASSSLQWLHTIVTLIF
jgi:hypothetical protein